MDFSELTSLPARARDLALPRLPQLGIGIGAVAVANVVMLEIFSHIPGGAGDGDKMPGFFGLAIVMLIGFLIVTACISWPMAMATTALTSDEDEGPAEFLKSVLPAALRQWIRLSILTSPFYLLGVWAIHALIGAMAQMFSSAATGGASPPGTPLPLSILEFLGQKPVAWSVGVIVVGAWCLLAAADGLDIDRSIIPRSLLKLVSSHIPAAPILAVISSVVLGEIMGRVISSTMLNIIPMGSEASKGSGFFAVFVLSLLLAAFVSVVATFWIALLADDGDLPVREYDPLGGLGGADETVADGTDAGASMAQAPIGGGPLVETLAVVDPQAPAGWWVYQQAGSTTELSVAFAGPTPPRLLCSDAAGNWHEFQPTNTPGCGAFTAPSEGWWYVAIYGQGQGPEQVNVRLQLPVGAQLQQQQAA